jgi:hypothetical protein
MNRHYCDRRCAEHEEGVCPGCFGEFCFIAWTPDEYKEIEDHEVYGSFEIDLEERIGIEMKNFWCRYLVLEEEAINFSYVGPWWITPVELIFQRDDVVGVCFAIRAKSSEGVDSWFRDHFDEGSVRQKIYIHEVEDNWVPFNEDFPREDWMVWPYRCVEDNR